MIRVFARKTKMTPTDDDAFYSEPSLFHRGNGETVHISCTFTYDKPYAHRLADAWADAGYSPVLGGPAYDDKGGEFEPGQYLKPGMVITSRGCNNHCWFCYTPKREGKIREIEIHDGWNVQDGNLLQCSDSHVRRVFEMLSQQDHKARFTGGLEAAILTDWHVNLIVSLKPERIYFAYDTPDDYEPLQVAAEKLIKRAGFCYSHVAVYVLIGYPKDTMDGAEKRLQSVCRLGMMPFAMLWRGEDGKFDQSWKRFQREWVNHVIVGSKMKQYTHNRKGTK
ncbi:hypothetical protein KAR91_13220 [Candidatus Pacearchaeota archaeon]|nr:hypothetical protein [Candidatus Pacearchaeota archaeon]